MNPISRFCVCRRSILRRIPLPRWSSEPISSSSLIPNNPISSNLIISKGFHHHSLNYPPAKIFFSIPGNYQSRNFSGEPECNFGHDDVANEISQLWRAIDKARGAIETCRLPPPDAIKIMADRFHASKQKLGLDIERKVHFPPHLRKFTKEIRSLKRYFDDVVDFGEYFIKSGGRSFTEYEDWCYPLTNEESQFARHMADEDAVSAAIAENLADNTNQGSRVPDGISNEFTPVLHVEAYFPQYTEIDQGALCIGNGAEDKKQGEVIAYLELQMGQANGNSQSSVERGMVSV